MDSSEIKNKIEEISKKIENQEYQIYQESADDEIRHIKQKQIENYWKQIGEYRTGREGREKQQEANKIFKEFLNDLKNGTFTNSIDFAAFKLGIDYKADLPAKRPKISKYEQT